MKLAVARLAQTWAHEDVTAWENEGGAIWSTPEATGNPVTTVGWPPTSVINPAPAVPAGADSGITDTSPLTIMRISLLLLVTALGSMAIFWSAIALNGPQ